MGIDTNKRKRQSGKATLKTTTVMPANVPASDRKVAKSDNQPKTDENMYAEIKAHIAANWQHGMDDAASSSVTANRGMQYTAASIIELFDLWLMQDHVAAKMCGPKRLAVILTDPGAKRDVVAAIKSHFKLTNDVDKRKMQDRAARALTLEDTIKFVNRALKFAAYLVRAGIGLEQFKDGVWTVPFPMLVMPDVRDKLDDERRAQVVPLTNAPWGFSYKVKLPTGTTTEEIEQFRSSAAQFEKAQKPPTNRQPRTGSGTTTTQTSTSGAANVAGNRQAVRIADLSRSLRNTPTRELTEGTNALDFQSAFFAMLKLWRDAGGNTKLYARTFDKNLWNDINEFMREVRAQQARDDFQTGNPDDALKPANDKAA